MAGINFISTTINNQRSIIKQRAVIDAIIANRNAAIANRNAAIANRIAAPIAVPIAAPIAAENEIILNHISNKIEYVPVPVPIDENPVIYLKRIN
jgi:hypothetical protein